ncbi:hypothetical protein E4U30_000319, partial [Claviceps sp. LM220 group G6]
MSPKTTKPTHQAASSTPSPSAKPPTPTSPVHTAAPLSAASLSAPSAYPLQPISDFSPTKQMPSPLHQALQAAPAGAPPGLLAFLYAEPVSPLGRPLERGATR